MHNVSQRYDTDGELLSVTPASLRHLDDDALQVVADRAQELNVAVEAEQKRRAALWTACPGATS
jgi:hypothetical protein